MAPDYVPMLLMDAPGDGDMPCIDGVGDMPCIDGVGDGPMSMFMAAPPRPMLWWMATHHSQTSSCTPPATQASSRPSSWVHTMYSRPWMKVQNTRPTAWVSVTMPRLICSTVYVFVCWNMWFQPASPAVCSRPQSLKFCRNWPEYRLLTRAV